MKPDSSVVLVTSALGETVAQHVLVAGYTQVEPVTPPADVAPLPELRPVAGLCDLAGTYGEAWALWYGERITSGAIAAYGKPARAVRALQSGARYEPIPAAAWRELAIQWCDGSAAQKVTALPNEDPAWTSLSIAQAHVMQGRAPSSSGAHLRVTFRDAARLAQRRRERQMLGDWPFPEAEFWQSHDRPNWWEAVRALEQAVVDGRLSAVVEHEPGAWRPWPALAWEAGPQRVRRHCGRINTGSIAPVSAQQWNLARLSLEEVKQWMVTTWPTDLPPPAAAIGTPADKDAPTSTPGKRTRAIDHSAAIAEGIRLLELGEPVEVVRQRLRDAEIRRGLSKDAARHRVADNIMPAVLQRCGKPGGG